MANIITDRQIISSKIKEAISYYESLEKCIHIIDLLDDGDLHDQLNLWSVDREETASIKRRLSYFIERLATTHGVVK